MISIVIPLFNKETQIGETLQSVFCQTYQKFEIVIVNDGSTDNSVREVEKIKDNRIRIIHQENQGVSVARNRGIRESRFNYIAFLDADDVWQPEYLQEQVGLIEKYPECRVYACAYTMRNSAGEEFELELNRIPFSGETGVLVNYFEVASCSHPPLWTSTVVADKGALLEVKGFPAGIKAGEDLLTWANLAVRFQIAYSLRRLAIFNYPENVDERKNRLEKQDLVYGKLLEIYNSVDKSRKKDLRKYIGRWNEMRVAIFINSGNKSRAFLPLRRMIKYKGINLKVIYLFVLIMVPSSFQRFILNKVVKKYYYKKK